jgi:hypothetical protein
MTSVLKMSSMGHDVNECRAKNSRLTCIMGMIATLHAKDATIQMKRTRKDDKRDVNGSKSV